MTKISIKTVNLNKQPYLIATSLKNIEVGSFITLLGEQSEVDKDVTESQFFLLPKTNKGLVIKKNDDNTVTVLKFNRVLGDGECIVLPFNELAVKLDVEELVLLAKFRY